MDTLNWSSGGREDWLIGTAPTDDEDDRQHQAVEQRLVRRLAYLGYQVTLQPQVA